MRYVGKSTSGLKRPKTHRAPSSTRGRTYRAHWLRALRRAGATPCIEILYQASVGLSLDDAERFWIQEMRQRGMPLTNLTDGGEGVPGKIIGRDQKRRQAATRMSGERPFMDQYGTVYPSQWEAAELLGISTNAINHTLKGRQHTAGGYIFSYLTETPKIHHKNAIVDQNGAIYQSIRDAGTALGIANQHISLVVRGLQRQTHGYTFRYLNPEAAKRPRRKDYLGPPPKRKRIRKKKASLCSM